MNIRERAQKLKTDIPAVFFAMKHRETPVMAKVLSGLAFCYALSPVDLIPDFIPVIGYLDDVLLLPVLVALAIKLIPQPVFEECREQAADFWAGESRSRWYFALPVLLVWLALLALIVWKLFL